MLCQRPLIPLRCFDVIFSLLVDLPLQATGPSTLLGPQGDIEIPAQDSQCEIGDHHPRLHSQVDEAPGRDIPVIQPGLVVQDLETTARDPDIFPLAVLHVMDDEVAVDVRRLLLPHQDLVCQANPRDVGKVPGQPLAETLRLGAAVFAQTVHVAGAPQFGAVGQKGYAEAGNGFGILNHVIRVQEQDPGLRATPPSKIPDLGPVGQDGRAGEGTGIHLAGQGTADQVRLRDVHDVQFGMTLVRDLDDVQVEFRTPRRCVLAQNLDSQIGGVVHDSHDLVDVRAYVGEEPTDATLAVLDQQVQRYLRPLPRLELLRPPEHHILAERIVIGCCDRAGEGKIVELIFVLIHVLISCQSIIVGSNTVCNICHLRSLPSPGLRFPVPSSPEQPILLFLSHQPSTDELPCFGPVHA